MPRVGGWESADLLVLSGAEVRDPVVTRELFMMNDQAQEEDALARYRTDASDSFAPVPGDRAAERYGSCWNDG